MNVPRAEAHYADCTTGDRTWLDRPGRWSVAEAVTVLKRYLGRNPVELDDDEDEVIAWCRRGLPELRSDQDKVTPEEIYRRVAASAAGEGMFASGRAGALRLGYGAALDGIDPWAVERFVGLGHPWARGMPEEGAHVLDCGCGAGVDLAIAARHVGASGSALGFDRLPFLIAAPGRRPPAPALLANAARLPLRPGWASLAIANGLPPLLGARSAPGVLSELHRVLVLGGELRFVTLVAGPDRPVEALSDAEVIDAIRCSKPVCAQYRKVLDDAGFCDVAIVEGPSPFIDGYRSGPVRAVLISATRR